MSIPKLHHYVPQFHLRRFADLGGYLWVWDKTSDRIFKATPKAIAAETDFYKLELTAKSGDDPMMMERHLSELEGDVAHITGRWLEWLVDRAPNKRITISRSQRWLVSMYIALQFFRTNDTKDILCRLGKGFVDGSIPEDEWYSVHATYLSNIDAILALMTDDGERDEIRSAVSQLSEPTKRDLHTRFLYDPRFVVLLADRIDKSIWIFGRNLSGTPFITSDNPVAFKTGDNRMWVKGGLLAPGTYAVFPLSPQIVLYCHDRVPPFDKLTRLDRAVSPVEFNASLVEQDNTGQVFMAGRFVISNVNNFESARDFASTIGTDKYAPPEMKGRMRKKH